MELRGRKITDQEVLEEVAARCRTDQVFRKALRQDPRAFLEGLGIVIPHDMELSVVGDTPETEALVFGGALTDDDLEKVAGGMTNQNVQGLSGGGSPTRAFYVLYGVPAQL